MPNRTNAYAYTRTCTPSVHQSNMVVPLDDRERLLQDVCSMQACLCLLGSQLTHLGLGLYNQSDHFFNIMMLSAPLTAMPALRSLATLPGFELDVPTALEEVQQQLPDDTAAGGMTGGSSNSSSSSSALADLPACRFFTALQHLDLLSARDPLSDMMPLLTWQMDHSAAGGGCLFPELRTLNMRQGLNALHALLLRQPNALPRLRSLSCLEWDQEGFVALLDSAFTDQLTSLRLERLV